MVSSDGESHALLTGCAVGAGLLCAIVVLLALVTAIDCSRQRRTADRRAKQQRSKSLFALFAKRQSLDITIVDERYLERVVGLGAAAAGASNTSSTETVASSCEYVDERRGTTAAVSASGAWRTTTTATTTATAHRIEETMFEGPGKLHGIATVSC